MNRKAVKKLRASIPPAASRHSLLSPALPRSGRRLHPVDRGEVGLLRDGYEDRRGAVHHEEAEDRYSYAY